MIGKSVCAVIVTYKPDPAFVTNIEAIEKQADHIVVIDNGSSADIEQLLRERESRSGWSIVCNHENLGIATALNQGVKYAMAAGFDWIATFDQDSRVSDNFIAAMLKTYHEACQPERIAIITPTYIDWKSGVRARLRRARNGEILTNMTSGSMMLSSMIKTVGLFEDDLFIDAVDTEFCLRARRKKLQILESTAILFHSPGRTTYHSFFGRPFGTMNQPAGRQYYITRNRLRLLARYAVDWPWAWRECRAMLYDTFKIALVEDDKWLKFRAMAMGASDALRGRGGKQLEI